MRSSAWRTVAVVVLAAGMTGLLGGRPGIALAQSDAVAPIDWSQFASGPPDDQEAAVVRRILRNTNRYALGTWFDATYGSQGGQPYLDFGGTGENQIRPPASEALALAISLKSGAYDAASAGRSVDDANAVAKRLVTSLALRHVANSSGGWGGSWQSALWSSYAGLAGWLMWPDLAPDDRERVRRMVAYEADRFIGYQVPYYRNAAGEIVSPGDTKAEENAWNSAILAVATAMMPHHEHWRDWMDKELELMVSGFARPSDVDRTEEINGKPLRLWLNGSNINEDGTLVNHGIIHPDYMTATALSANAALVYGLDGKATPAASLFNDDVVYRSLVDLPFASPPFEAPGGTIYIDGSGEIYYPTGTDWGRFRALPFALQDLQAQLFGLDRDASVPAHVWEGLHMGRELQLQSRFGDGRTWGDFSEFQYAGREQFAAVQAAQAYLFLWLAHNDALRVTNEGYPPPPPSERADGVSMTVDAPDRFVPGQDGRVGIVLHDDGDADLSHVRFDLSLPDGWTAQEPASALRSVPAGSSASVEIVVHSPAVALPGQLT